MASLNRIEPNAPYTIGCAAACTAIDVGDYEPRNPLTTQPPASIRTPSRAGGPNANDANENALNSKAYFSATSGGWRPLEPSAWQGEGAASPSRASTFGLDRDGEPSPKPVLDP